MNYGGSEDTGCREVLAGMWLLLDGECDAERRELMQTHLEKCEVCSGKVGLEARLKKLLACKCGGERAPDRLRQRLKDFVREKVGSQPRRRGHELSPSPEKRRWRC